MSCGSSEKTPDNLMATEGWAEATRVKRVDHCLKVSEDGISVGEVPRGGLQRWSILS